MLGHEDSFGATIISPLRTAGSGGEMSGASDPPPIIPVDRNSMIAAPSPQSISSADTFPSAGPASSSLMSRESIPEHEFRHGNARGMNRPITPEPDVDETPVIRVVTDDSLAVGAGRSTIVPAFVSASASGDSSVTDSSADGGSAEPAIINPTCMSDVLATSPDFDALKAFYKDTGGSCWTKKTGWSSAWSTKPTKPSTSDWTGIQLDDSNRVVAITLSNGLTGPLPEQIENLTRLREIRLKDNALEVPIPRGLFKLPCLTVLDVHNNELEGEIPAETGMLVNLIQLRLSGNCFISRVPKELGNLVHLEVLHLHNNRLEGDVPMELGQLIKLRELRIDDNDLSGVLPDIFANMPHLQLFNCFQNKLEGKVPRSLANLEKLERAMLARNKFHEDSANRCITKYTITKEKDMRKFKAQLLECDTISTPSSPSPPKPAKATNSPAAKKGRRREGGPEDGASKRRRLHADYDGNEGGGSTNIASSPSSSSQVNEKEKEMAEREALVKEREDRVADGELKLKTKKRDQGKDFKKKKADLVELENQFEARMFEREAAVAGREALATSVKSKLENDKQALTQQREDGVRKRKADIAEHQKLLEGLKDREKKLVALEDRDKSVKSKKELLDKREITLNEKEEEMKRQISKWESERSNAPIASVGNSEDGGSSSSGSNTDNDILSSEMGTALMSCNMFKQVDVIKYVRGLHRLRIPTKKALRSYRKEELVEKLAAEIGVGEFHVPQFVGFWEGLRSEST